MHKSRRDPSRQIQYMPRLAMPIPVRRRPEASADEGTDETLAQGTRPPRRFSPSSH